MSRISRTVRTLLLSLLLAAAPAFAAPAAAAPSLPSAIRVNGRPVQMDQGPAIVDGNLMIPLRAVMEAAGADVTWEADTQTVTVHWDQSFAIFVIGRPSGEYRKVGVFYIRPNLIDIAHAPVIVGNRTLIPEDALTRVLGLSEQWDADGTLELSTAAPS